MMKVVKVTEKYFIVKNDEGWFNPNEAEKIAHSLGNKSTGWAFIGKKYTKVFFE